MKTVWIKKLTRLLGKTKVSNDPAVLENHSKDKWFASRRPEAAVFAQTTDDVQRLMRFASKNRIPVTPRGSGTGHVGGCVPARGGIVLSLTRMKRIKEISAADGLAVVQPGVITGRLQEEAKKRGLFYPPDPASLNECSIGGNIATNAGGPRCLKYGVTRNYILGLEVVLASGEAVRMGGRSVKNKTGFSLDQLFAGSEGMLGVMTEATLRLLPLPPARGVVVGSFRSARAAVKAVMMIQEKGILPAAIEIADDFTLRAAREFTGKIPPGKTLVLVESDGQQHAVRDEIAAVARIFRQCKALKISQAKGEEKCEQLWAMRRAFSDALKATGLKKINEDVAVPRSRVAELFSLAEKMGKRSGAPIACFGHIGDGNIHCNMMVSPETGPHNRQNERLLDELFENVIRWHGAITGEHGIGLAKKRWWPRAASPSLQTLHIQLKRALDPLNILNPGKFLDE